MKSYWVYILASKTKGVLYVGVTNEIKNRVYEHKTKTKPGFTKKYNVSRLVYLEEFNDVNEAIKREKRLKKWKRDWKIRLIDENNPNWDDLFEQIL